MFFNGVRTLASKGDPELMQRPGYDRYVSQGGDWGSVVADAMPSHKRNDGLAARITRNRAIDARVAEKSEPAGPARSPRKAKAYSRGKEDATFTHAEAFPLIASVVSKLCSAKNDFVGHREIVEAMLSDPSLDLITVRNPEAHPRDWWAHSMMKWFSQAFTGGTNDYCQAFEREADTRPYRYKISQK